MAITDIIKRPFRSFNGTKWTKHYFETSADQVIVEKGDGIESNVQTELGAIGEISNLSTINKASLVEAVNELVGKTGGNTVYNVFSINTTNLDAPPQAFILQTGSVRPVGFPDKIGGDAVLVLQQNPGSLWSAQLAFSYGGKIALRSRRNGTWSAWTYVTPQ